MASKAVKQRYFVKASPSKVFNAITEPRILKKWFLGTAKLSPRKGGNYTFTWRGDPTLQSGKVLSFVRDKSLSLSWPALQKGKQVGMTRATFRLKAKEDGTILDLNHTGFRSGAWWNENYAAVCSGWAYFLLNLKSVLQYGRDLRSPEDVF
jgi:uncharacterized protein YndB with AHSA1/START domain